MTRLLVVLGLVVVACSAGTVETTTPALAPATTGPASTSSTVEETTTTVPEVVVLGYSNDRTKLRMQVDRTYVHDLNVVPIAFRFAQPGWDLLLVGDDLLGMFHSTEPFVAFHVSFFPSTSATDVAAHISELIETEIRLTGAGEIGGVEGLFFEVGPGFGREPFDADRPCLLRTLIEERVLDARVNTFLAPCSVNRVWVAEVDGGSVALHVTDVDGTADQPGDLVRVEPLIDQFLDAITFNP